MKIALLFTIPLLAGAFYPSSVPDRTTRSNIAASSLHFPKIPANSFKRNPIILSQAPTDAEEKKDKMLEAVINNVGKTTSAFVAGTFYIVLAFKRDALMTSFFIGAISNGILSKVLKKILKQERPAELNESELDLPPSDNGMPSSHAMSLGFIGTFTALLLPWTSLPVLAYVIISLIYRIETKLHTFDQIVVGLILGILNAVTWHSLCFGTNPFVKINVMDLVTENLLNEQGQLPIYALSVPAVVGALVVGSVERRLARFFKSKQSKE